MNSKFVWMGIFLVLFISGCREEDAVYRGNVVKIEGTKGNWILTVNGKPLALKGVGVGRAMGREGKVDYLKLAKDMGANVVRTWGIDQGNAQ